MAGEDRQNGAPYANLLEAIVDKIQVQPFLFIIAIVALIVALVIVGTGLESSDFRFVVLAIAGLAVVAITGYYLQQARKSMADAGPPPSPEPTSEKRGQTMEAEEGGRIARAGQQSEAATDQTMRAAGPGSRLEDVQQRSGAPAQPEPSAADRSRISQELHTRLRESLVECAPLESDEALAPILADDRLTPWRDKLPATGGVQARAEGIIDVLHDKTNALGENALVLFLHVTAERLDPADACRERLLALAQELRSPS